ncbi:MAG: hypothetical protein ABI113_13125, partial [Mucilaginibacter sp.]
TVILYEMIIKKIIYLSFVILTIAAISSCSKKSEKTSSCTKDATIEYRWDNVSIETQTLNSSGTVTGSSFQYPAGYILLNPDHTYNRPSNGVTLNGGWEINSNCELALDKTTSDARTFAIDKVTVDSLVISRKDVSLSVKYVQRYKKH